MSCVFLLFQGKNADKLSHVDKQCKILAAFCYLNRDTFISQCAAYQTDAKMWANQSSELTERLCLHYIFWFVWLLFLAMHKRAINGKSYSNRYFFLWATHTAPPTTQLHECKKKKKTQPRFVLTRDAKWLKCVTVFPVSVCTFILFLYQDFQDKQHRLTNGHLQRDDCGMPVSMPGSRIQEASTPPCHQPHMAGRPRTPAPTNTAVRSGREHLRVLKQWPRLKSFQWNEVITEAFPQ